MFRRPDVAYPKGLAWVCAVFLNIFGEYESFELLCNIVQKYHYQCFFLRGDIQDVNKKIFNYYLGEVEIIIFVSDIPRQSKIQIKSEQVDEKNI